MRSRQRVSRISECYAIHVFISYHCSYAASRSIELLERRGRIGIPNSSYGPSFYASIISSWRCTGCRTPGRGILPRRATGVCICGRSRCQSNWPVPLRALSNPTAHLNEVARDRVPLRQRQTYSGWITRCAE